MINVYIQSSKQSLNKERMRNLNFYNPKILPQLQTNPYLCSKANKCKV